MNLGGRKESYQVSTESSSRHPLPIVLLSLLDFQGLSLRFLCGGLDVDLDIGPQYQGDNIRELNEQHEHSTISPARDRRLPCDGGQFRGRTELDVKHRSPLALERRDLFCRWDQVGGGYRRTRSGNGSDFSFDEFWRYLGTQYRSDFDLAMCCVVSRWQ